MSNIIDRIEDVEQDFMKANVRAPEYLILDTVSWEQLSYELENEDIFTFNGYIVAKVNNREDEIIKLV